jgi:hypothetical protein
MRFAQIQKPKFRYILLSSTVIAAIILVAPACRAQTAQASPPDKAWSQELSKHPGLLPEFGKLVQKLQQNIEFPAPRSESRLLPLLPESTMVYAASSNWGDAAEQALKIFRQERQESQVLRDWWQHGELAASGPKMEDALDKLAQLQQYLGEEIVISASLEGQEPKPLIIAEVRKPGLKKFLQETVAQLAGGAKSSVRLLDPQELAAAKDQDKGAPNDLLVLVRPDFVVAALDVATLRNCNARIDSHSRKFAATPFGQRIAKEYEGGVTLLAAADLHRILEQAPAEMKQNMNLQRSGFADVQYLVWERKRVSGQAVSQTELSFIATRRGPAAWLANSGPLNSVDFISPKAMIAATLLLESPSRIFDDVKELYSDSKSSPFATLPAFEQMLKLSVKDDLLGTLSGEIALELDSVAPPAPVWKAILGVRDADRLQQTLTKLLAVAHLEAQQSEDAGVTHYTVQIPSAKNPIAIDYAFVDGYLIAGSSSETVADAVRMHKTGGSLGKTKTFLASLPPGRSPEASAMFYQDPTAMAALRLRQLGPEIAEAIAQNSKDTTPPVAWVYGEPSAIRTASRSGALDVGAVAVAAAIAIPNLIRARMAANEASAVGSVRSVNTAEITYSGMFPARGFAPDLATLGIDSRHPGSTSPDHAGFLAATLANESCTGDAWCTKSGYRFRVAAVCKQRLCEEYVVVAMPVDSNTGTRSFCSASDGVVHYKTGSAVALPPSAAECKAWPVLR